MKYDLFFVCARKEYQFLKSVKGIEVSYRHIRRSTKKVLYSRDKVVYNSIVHYWTDK